MPRLILAILFCVVAASAVRAEELVLFGAGSLREALTGIARDFAAANGMTVRTEWGPSGRLSERIEQGERVDVFASADVAHPRKLVEDGRAQLMAVFAANAICALAPARLDITPETALHRLLAPGIKLGVSPPKADPLGDDTVELFRRAEALRPGAAAALQARAVVLDVMPGPPRTGDANVDAIEKGRVDASIVYCSGRARYARLLPDAALVRLPPSMQVKVFYALAVAADASPKALLLAQTILAPAGQQTLAAAGFEPLRLPPGGP